MMDDTRATDAGFDYDGTFYRWQVSDHGKDLMLIDRFTAMPIPRFFEIVSDGLELERGPILLAMVATSIRAHHPDWSVDRIERIVLELRLSEITIIDPEQEDDGRPPADGAAEPQNEPPALSTSQPDGSSSSLTPKDNSNFEMSYAHPA